MVCECVSLGLRVRVSVQWGEWENRKRRGRENCPRQYHIGIWQYKYRKCKRERDKRERETERERERVMASKSERKRDNNHVRVENWVSE